jgi:hypothetical protein
VAINYRSRDAAGDGRRRRHRGQGGEAIALPADMASEADIVRLFHETTACSGRSPIWSTAPASAQHAGRRYDAAG